MRGFVVGGIAAPWWGLATERWWLDAIGAVLADIVAALDGAVDRRPRTTPRARRAGRDGDAAMTEGARRRAPSR